jgi:DNA (cytosine-5)-methyltransferase 1
MTPEGWRRINLGGRIKGGLDADGNPIVSGARYAVYNPTDRKAYIYTDNDFALTGERTRNAAFNLSVADKLFKHNPIMGYKDPVDGVQRMVLGITRDAGVRVRDIKDDLSSTIKVVPLSDIRDKKIAKRIDEVMQEQGVLANKAPAPYTPEAFMNADKMAFPDEVSIDESGPIAGRVVSQIGKKDSNMFVVALPDGSHIRLNGGSINVGKPGSVLVRGKLAESQFPTSLADLVAPKGGLENQAFIKDGEQFHHLQLTPDQKSLYARVKSKFSAEIRAAKDEPDDARREAMIGIVKNKMADEFARVATIAPPSGKFKDADVIDVSLEQGKFKGVPQTAIVVGRNKFGYQVRLVDHTNIGEFTVPEALIAGYDPSMGMPDAETNFEGPTADGSMPKSAMPGPGTVPIGRPLGPGAKPKVNTSNVREGVNLTVDENPDADNVDFHELPDPVRARLDSTLTKHGDHIKRLGIGNAITINENSADAIHDITIKRIDPTSWQYTMRTSEVDPKTRAVTKQYVSDYTLSVDEKTGDIVATIGKQTDQGQQGQQTPGEIKTESDAVKALKATEFVGRHQVRFLDMPVQVFKKKPDGTGFAVGPNNKPIVDSTPIKTPIYDSNGRKIVVAKINGVQVPFYLSTGAAGKKTVASGKWYPFFGIAPSDDSPGGWLNKGSEAAINDYYGSSHLKEVAQHLDNILGDIRNVKTITSFGFRADGSRNKAFDFINQGLNPTENKKATTASAFAANVKNVIDALESAAPAIVGGQTVMAYQTDSESEAGQPSAPQFEPGSTTRGRAAMARRYILGRVNLADAFEYKRQRTLIEQNSTMSQADKEKEIIALEKQFKETLDNLIKQGLFNLNRITTQDRLPEGMNATGSREERYGYKIKSKEGNDLTQLQYAETEQAGINDKEVIQTAVKMGKDTFLLNAIRVSNKKQLATVLSEQYKVNSQVAGYISDIVDRFARGWALDKVNAQIGRAHDLFESTGKLQEHLANRKPGEYADTRGMYFRQFARTEPEVNKAVSEFMREFYRERFAAFAVLDQATSYDDKYKGAIFKAVKDNNTAFNVIVGFSSRNVSTAIHEIAHALLRGMSDENKALVIERFHHAARGKDNKLPQDIEEAWAGSFEAALMRGQFPQNYAAQKMFSQGIEKNRLLYDPVLQKTWEEVGHYLNGVRQIVIKKRDEQGLPTNSEYRSGQVFWEAPYKTTERLFKGMSIEVIMPGGAKEFGVVMKAQPQTGMPIQVRMNSGSVETITPSQITRIAGWSDGFNSAVLDLVANLTRQNYTQHMRELQASNPEFFQGYSSNKATITGSYDTELATSPRKVAFQTNVENQLNEDGWFADKKDIATIKKYVSGLVDSGRVILDAEGKVEQVLDQRGKPSFAYSVLQTINGYTPETALAMYAITETPEFRKWSGGKPLVEAVYNTDVRANMPVEQLMSEERVMIRQMMAGIDLLKALKAAYRGDRTDDLIGDIEVLSKDYYGYNTQDSKKAAEMAEFYTSDTDESNTALAGLIASLDYEINKSTKFDMVRHLSQSSIDYRSAMRKPRTGTGFVTMAFHPNGSHAWLPREGGYIIPNGVSDVDGVGRGGAYIRMNNPLVVDLKNNGMAIDRVAKYKEQAKATGRDSVVLLNVRHSIGGANTLHNMVIPMNDHPLRVMDSMGKVNLSTFFSGGGLIEAGSKDVATPIKAVEFDKGVASVYRSNHGDHVEVGDVRNVDIASMVGTEWFHASPVCKNYSVASTAKTESNEDITTAKAVVDVVDRIQPPVVTIENVKQYEGTEAFNMIIDALNRNGYNHQTAVYKTSDFAGSTMRERLLIRATRGFALPPITQNKLYKAKSWYEAVEDLIDDMPIGQLTQQQAKQFADRGINLATIDQPYLVQSTSKGAPQKMYGPAYTVMAGTGQAMRIVLPGGIVKVVTDRALARWQGLPDSYVLPKAHTLANKVVGNGVPTELTKYVLSPVAEAYMKHKAKQTTTAAMRETDMAFQSSGEEEMAFQSPYNPAMSMGNRTYTQPASPGAPSTVTRIMPRSFPSGYGRWWAAVDFLNDITRMVLSGDLAFTTLQAGIIGLSNPKLGLQAMLAGLKGFAPNMQIEVNGQKIGSRKLGREVYHKVGDQMRANPAYNIAREAGLKLQMFEIDERFNDMREVELANLRNEDPTATLDDCKTTLMDVDELGTNDEWYMKNRITRHLPGQGQFERYNSILHDTILLTQFDNWYKSLLSMGYEPGSEKFNQAMKDTARILNVSVGDIEYSTDATRDAAASRIAKVMFTAPRWLMSRALIDPMINTVLSNSSWVRDVMGHDNPVFDLYKSGKVDPAIRRMGISMWLRVAGAQIAMMLMAILYQNWNPDVEANADRSFGRIRVGDVRFDPPAGIFDHYRLGIRLYQALLATDPKNVQKAEKAGVPLWYYQFEDLRKEMQYKSSPLVNTVVSMFGGNDPAAMFNGFEGLQNAQAKSVVGEPYYGSNEPATFFYDSFIRQRVAELFGPEVADNGGFSNAFIERLPTVFPQFMDAYYRAYEYDRPPLAYALANMIPNFLGFKVEVTPAEYLKDRVKNRNEDAESPNILKLLSEGGGLKAITGQ